MCKYWNNAVVLAQLENSSIESGKRKLITEAITDSLASPLNDDRQMSHIVNNRTDPRRN